MIELFFLGTSGTFPTKERNHPAILLRYEGYYYLLDCGEGTQRQMRKVGISPCDIDAILLTHMHGDHTLGVPGLLESMMNSGRERKLTIVGPPGTELRIYYAMRFVGFPKCFDVEIIEAERGVIFDEKDHIIRCFPLYHGIPCIGYVFEEKPRRKINLEFIEKLGIPRGPLLGKLQRGESIEWKGRIIRPEEATILVEGKKVAYITDTVYSPQIAKDVGECDILIIECMFGEDVQNPRDKMHLTVDDVAKIISELKPSYVFLTHFSQRYKDVSTLVNELTEKVKDVNANIIAAEDLMHVIIKRDSVEIEEIPD